ncbi:MAG TPA: tetratricopeptide repeat protein [Longimicrobiaceae bacterium]|nr:tetratricopeptide repeat protein [Longimicrobiaceae bacterium]
MASPSVASRTRNTSRGPDNDDIVMARAIQFSEWARRNAKIVIAVSVAALIVVGGLFYYRIYREQRAERAAVQLSQVEQTVASGNATLALRDLGDFSRRFGGTVEADQARLMQARLHLEANEPAKAVAVLQEMGEGPRTVVGAQGGLLLAAAHNQAGNRQAAIDAYLRVADAAQLDYLRQEALEGAALLRQQAGDFAGAAELYRRLLGTTEEGSFQRSVYEMRLAEAEARAQAK